MAQLIKKLLSSNDVITHINNSDSKDLEEMILYCSDKYYNETPVVSDGVYDMMIDFLKKKDPKSPIIKKIGAKVKGRNKVQLDYWLGSMDKIKLKQLDVFKTKYKGEYNISDKMDGISALLIYNNKKIMLHTRGTAEEGSDITKLVKYLNLPNYNVIEKYCIKNKIHGNKNMIAFRGELIMKDIIFKEKWGDKFKNPRNAVSGLVASKLIDPDFAMDCDLILYEVIDPFYTINKQYTIIEDIGFNIVTNSNVKDISIEMLSKLLKKRREKSDYTIDGLIITDTNVNERNVSGNPEYAFAFKDVLDEMIKVTTITNIEWNISKDGYIIPTILLEPVDIGGVTIQRVSGHNAKNVLEQGLGIGAIIEIIRSGDVIPYVQKVIKKAKVLMPTIPWHWSESGVDIILDKNNIDVLKKNIAFFFSTIKTKGLGEAIASRLVESGYDSIEKILEAKESDFIKLDGFKEKSASNLYNAIHESLNVPLYKIMAASNKLGHGMGIERMKQILVAYPNIMKDYKKWEYDEFIDKIREIDGWEEKLATQFVNNINSFITFYNSIKKYIIIKVESKIGSKFTNKIFVFTGFRDQELMKKIENNGGKIGASISKNTSYLVVLNKDDTSSKIIKAVELGIKIISKDELIKML